MDFELYPAIDPEDPGGAQHRAPPVRIADPNPQLVVQTLSRTTSKGLPAIAELRTGGHAQDRRRNFLVR